MPDMLRLVRLPDEELDLGPQGPDHSRQGR
jgi:hypothetical protein